MIPTSILIALFFFIILYGIGLIGTVGLMINSLKNKEYFISFIVFILFVMYIVFGLMLI